MAADFGNVLPGIAAGAFVEAHHYFVYRGLLVRYTAKVQGVRWLCRQVFAPENSLRNGNGLRAAKANNAYSPLTGWGGNGHNGIGSMVVQHGAKVRWLHGIPHGAFAGGYCRTFGAQTTTICGQ
jgi:hypothetical protein